MTNCSTNSTIYLIPSGNVSELHYREVCREGQLRPSSKLKDFLECKLGPLPILLTIATNLLIFAVLTRRHMISPTNIILLAIAVADLATVTFPLPLYIAKNSQSFLSHPSITRLYADMILCFLLPTVFHTASIWLTVSLAVQRFIYVTFPTRASTICTLSGSHRVVAVIFITATISHLSLILGVEFVPYTKLCLNNYTIPITSSPSIPSLTATVNVTSSATVAGTGFSRCDLTSNTFNVFYYWFRVFIMHVVPCLSLSLLTVLLMMAIHEAEAKRRKLVSNNGASTTINKPPGESSSSRRMKEANKTSKMLLVVLLLFLLVEIPIGVSILLYSSSMAFKLKSLGSIHWASVTTVLNFCLLVSYPANFFVYCAMSTQFRETFNSLFVGAAGADGNRGGGTNKRRKHHHQAEMTTRAAVTVGERHVIDNAIIKNELGDVEEVKHLTEKGQMAASNSSVTNLETQHVQTDSINPWALITINGNTMLDEHQPTPVDAIELVDNEKKEEVQRLMETEA